MAMGTIIECIKEASHAKCNGCPAYSQGDCKEVEETQCVYYNKGEQLVDYFKQISGYKEWKY